MPITERGRWSSSSLDERGRAVFGALSERGRGVFGTTDGGVDGSTAFATRQTAYNDSSTAIATRQTAYNQTVTAIATRQTIYSQAAADMATRQTIYAISAVDFATTQNLYSDYIIGSTAFATRQTITNQASAVFATSQRMTLTGALEYAASLRWFAADAFQAATRQIIAWENQTAVATRQTLYTTGSTLAAVRVTFFDPDQTIVGTIAFVGDFDLLETLAGDFALIDTLKGAIDMTIEGQNSEFRKGDTRLLDFVVPHDLAGAQAIKWGLFNTAYDEVPVISKTLGSGITIKSTSQSSSVFTVRIDPADTATLEAKNYYHEARVKDSIGQVATPTTGTITLEPSALDL